MRHCNACNIDISTPAQICPLCGAPLTGQAGARAYPELGFQKRRHLARRILLFCTLVSVAICALINLLTMPHFWWWLIVATSLAYAWAAVPHMLRVGGNAGGKILMQVVCAGALAALLDVETGWRGWSVDFVLPAIFCIGIVAVMIVILCNWTNWARYVLYQVTLAVFGFLPLVLYWTGVTRIFWPAAVPALLALVSLAALALFGDRSIKNEFARRLRF